MLNIVISKLHLWYNCQRNSTFYKFVDIVESDAENVNKVLRRHDTQHKNIKHKDTQHKDIKHNDIQHNNKKKRHSA